MKKALVIGVILLFLGVVFQPALANEVSITTTSDFEQYQIDKENEEIKDCKPCLLEELFKDYDSLKMLKFGLSNLTDKFRINTGETLICKFLSSLLYFYLVYGGVILMIGSLIVKLFPKLYPITENIFDMINRIRGKMDKICILYEDVYDCGKHELCP